MNILEFRAWPKIARLNRGVIITEKIDGTNAAVIIVEDDFEYGPQDDIAKYITVAGVGYWVGAQSRTRIITPEDDNSGFAAWVYGNATELVRILGIGHHFGEWWGSGIQRGYGLPKGEKRFSLFNTTRWAGDERLDYIPSLDVVPVLYAGPFGHYAVEDALHQLRKSGSQAAPFLNPEGIVVFHGASRQMFKVTLEGDEVPKGQVAA